MKPQNDVHQRGFHGELVEKSWPQRIATQRWIQAAFGSDFVDVFPPKHSLRSGFTVSFVLSSVNQLFATVASRSLWSLQRGLAPSMGAPGPHDFFRPRKQSRSSVSPSASTAFHPNVRDDRETPLDERDGTKREHKVSSRMSQGNDAGRNCRGSLS